MEATVSPFGGQEICIEKIPIGYIVQRYKVKCGLDISDDFKYIDYVYLCECKLTGYRYWKPFHVAGKRNLYMKLSSVLSNYYRYERWEYSKVRTLLKKNFDVLEVGCGRGFFLKSIEDMIKSGIGLELNPFAIKDKVTSFPVKSIKIGDINKEGRKFDVICSFQVLEHLIQPKIFLQNCIKLLKPKGLLIISTPNYSYIAHQKKLDCFDLPPHHMGHYTDSVFKNIGNLLDLDISCIYKQLRKDDLSIMVTEKSKNTIIYRIYRKIISTLTRIIFTILKEEGHSILVVFKKK